MENEKKPNANIPRAPRPKMSQGMSVDKPAAASRNVPLKPVVNPSEETIPLRMGAKKPSMPLKNTAPAEKKSSAGESVNSGRPMRSVDDGVSNVRSAARPETGNKQQVKQPITAPVKNQAPVASGRPASHQQVNNAKQAPLAKAAPMQKSQSRVQTSNNAQAPSRVQTSNNQVSRTPLMQNRQNAAPTASHNQMKRSANRIEPERITSPEKQRRRETVDSYKYESPKRAKKIGFFRIFGQACAFLFTFVLILALTVFISLKMMCSDTSPAAKELLVTTLLETGQMKGVASLFLSEKEIQAIVDGNAMSSFDDEIDSTLITIDKNEADNGSSEKKDIEIVEIAGRNFFGTLMIVKDPSRVTLASTYPFTKEGVTLDQLVQNAGAVGGINGGLYNSNNNAGGRPYGVLVCNGEIQQNSPGEWPGLVLIGFTEDDILEIIPIDGYSKKDIENLVAERKIRDAVCFQEEASDKNNHFVQLVINGEARDMNGMGSGLNPRTAIGQCADGSVLLLVTDGRGKSGHLGASASDLIEVMLEYGAVNAANLDGGSSSCMYYNGEYLMTSVTFYYTNASWKLPAGFVVK